MALQDLEEVSALKIRIKWSKTGVLRYIGHLDVQRYFHKAMMRAGLPIAFSKGMSPHQITSFAAPLGIGMTSEGEYMDATFNWSYSSEEMLRRLNEVMNEGISVLEFRQIDEKEKNCMAMTAASDYLVTFRPGYYVTEAFTKRTQAFFFQEQIMILKKTKRSEQEVDIAPLILAIREQGNGIYLKLVTGSAENLKPQLVMEAFCNYLGYDYDPAAFMYHRLETYLEKDGELLPLGSVGKDLIAASDEKIGYEEFLIREAEEKKKEAERARQAEIEAQRQKEERARKRAEKALRKAAYEANAAKEAAAKEDE